jgi:hypothetical protein
MTLSNLSFESLLRFLEGSVLRNPYQHYHKLSLNPVLKQALSVFFFYTMQTLMSRAYCILNAPAFKKPHLF